MFEKITKKIFDKTKTIAKKEISVTIDKQMPTILGVILVGIIILSFMEPTKKQKTTEASTIIINNYYF